MGKKQRATVVETELDFTETIALALETNGIKRIGLRFDGGLRDKMTPEEFAGLLNGLVIAELKRAG